MGAGGRLRPPPGPPAFFGCVTTRVRFFTGGASTAGFDWHYPVETRMKNQPSGPLDERLFIRELLTYRMRPDEIPQPTSATTCFAIPTDPRSGSSSQRTQQGVVEYTLRDSGKPMGVAQYPHSPSLPERLKNDLPIGRGVGD